MTPEQLKWGLEKYSAARFDITQQFFVHRDDKTGQQTMLPFHDVAEQALGLIERMELLLAVAKESEPLRVYLHMEQRIEQERRRADGLERRVAAQNKQIERQVEMIRDAKKTA